MYNNQNYQKQIQEFLTVAQEYCIFIHTASDRKKLEFLNMLQKILPLVYLKGGLINIDLTFDDVDLEPYTERFVNEEQWVNVFEQIKTILGNDNEFIHYNNINEINEKLSIAEYLADIFQDLMDFTILYNKGLELHKKAAVADCIKLFRTNWGQKCCRLLNPIHEILYKNELNIDEN